MKKLHNVALLLILTLMLTLLGGFSMTAETAETPVEPEVPAVPEEPVRSFMRYDFDGDSSRTTADAILLLRRIDGWDDGIFEELEGDVSDDGRISVYDAVCFLKILANDAFQMEKALKVATYNIKAGYYTRNTLPKIAALIKDLDADIVGLQEVDLNSKRSGNGNQVAYLAEACGYPYYYFAPVVSLSNTHVIPTEEVIAGQYNLYGHGILSKYPIESYEMIYPESQPVDAEIRGVERYEINVNGKIIAVYNGHLSGKTIGNAQYAEIQNEYMMKDKYAVFMGDTNCTPEMLTDFNYDRFQFLTHYDPFDDTPIDHIFVSNDTIAWYEETLNEVEHVSAFTVESYKVDEPFEFTTSSGKTYMEYEASDHNCRYAYIMLKDA